MRPYGFPVFLRLEVEISLDSREQGGSRSYPATPMTRGLCLLIRCTWAWARSFRCHLQQNSLTALLERASPSAEARAGCDANTVSGAPTAWSSCSRSCSRFTRETSKRAQSGLKLLKSTGQPVPRALVWQPEPSWSALFNVSWINRPSD